jgi:hypothetical protein
LQLPELFRRLKDSQQETVLALLTPLDATLQQNVLDEWAARCLSGNNIRNPAGYLCGIINKAVKGEFTAWAAGHEPAHPAANLPPAQPLPEKEPYQRASPETVQACMEQLRMFARNAGAAPRMARPQRMPCGEGHHSTREKE